MKKKGNKNNKGRKKLFPKIFSNNDFDLALAAYFLKQVSADDLPEGWSIKDEIMFRIFQIVAQARIG